MAKRGEFIGLGPWLNTPPGRYLLAWEQAQLEECVANVFGYHALQLGLPELDALRANRMPHRWLAVDKVVPVVESSALLEVPAVPRAITLYSAFDSLPFDSQSLDLVVMPHTLELTDDPHLALREVERVLMPEGRVAIIGFNPGSLWALRQRIGRMRRGLGGRKGEPSFMPGDGEYLGYWRLRDWLRLLSFDVEVGRFGCYKPPMRSQKWLDRFEWVEPVGHQWWPVFGAVYLLVAVKRVRGMRLIGMVKQPPGKPKPAPAVVRSQRSHFSFEHPEDSQ